MRFLLAFLTSYFAFSALVKAQDEHDLSPDYPTWATFHSDSENSILQVECEPTGLVDEIICRTTFTAVTKSEPTPSRWEALLDTTTPREERARLRRELRETRALVCRASETVSFQPESQLSEGRRRYILEERARYMEYRRILCESCAGDACISQAIRADAANQPAGLCHVATKTFSANFRRLSQGLWISVLTSNMCQIETTMRLEGARVGNDYEWTFLQSRRALNVADYQPDALCYADPSATMRFVNTPFGMSLSILCASMTLSPIY